jgi:hypothetical protein
MATPVVAFVQAATAATTTVTFSAGVVKKGDLILVWAGRIGSNTAPTLATGFTSINSGGLNTTSIRCGWKIATVNDDTVGTWTNATNVTAAIYRNVHQTAPIGTNVMLNGNATSTTVTFALFTNQQFDKSSWVAVGIIFGSSTGVATAPSGMTNRVSSTTLPCDDTNGGVASITPGTVTITAQAWRYVIVEIKGLERVSSTT